MPEKVKGMKTLAETHPAGSLIEPQERIDEIINETEELIQIFASSIRTAEKNKKKRK